MQYNHIILTRFNLDYEDDPQARCLQPEWLEKRFDLFETYCLPSIKQQTCQNFTWVILSSEATPEQYKERLLSYQTNNIQIVFCPKYKDTEINHLYQIIGCRYSQDFQFLVSTRLDSDDMLHACFVERIQTYLSTNNIEPTVLAFPKGIQWLIEEQIAYSISWKLAHFHTFVEKVGDIHTSLGVDHTKIPKSKITFLPDEDMWCELKKKKNLCNDYAPHLHYHLHNQHGQYPVFIPNEIAARKFMFLLKKHVKLRIKQGKRFLSKIFLGHNA